MMTYMINRTITANELAKLFVEAGIHRPATDLARLQQMLDHADLLISAWDEQQLVGIARALTDFSYACYLSDLAVAQDYQRQGIGQELLRRVQAAIGSEVTLVLLAAPSAMTYYPHVGFEAAANAFIIPRQPFD